MKSWKWTAVSIGLTVMPTSFLCAEDVVTSDQGAPNQYAPLKDSSAYGAGETPNLSGTVFQQEAAMLNQSAVAHSAVVHTSNGPSAAPLEIGSYTPPSLSSLPNAVSYIQHQMSGTQGLPKTYYVPSRVVTVSQTINQGVGLYDTALAIMALVQSGNLSEAQGILNVYGSGHYGNGGNGLPEVLTAYPTSNNGEAFAPFNSATYYYFDQADANAQYESSWNQYGCHTGPNAWLALALAEYIQGQRKAGQSDATLAPYLSMLTRLGDAMMMLQDSQTQGGIRYGPRASFEDPFNTINTENDISAYAALTAIAGVTGQSKYKTAAALVVNWLKGMRDPTTGLFYVGADYTNGKWVIQKQVMEDSGGSWVISALGPQLIDATWGKGAALSMWQSIRSLFGRTETTPGNPLTITNAGPKDTLIGVDYSNQYPSYEALVSPEWTGGAVNALKQIISYYKISQVNLVADNAAGLTIQQARQMYADLQSMQNFLASGQNSYAVGPGLTNARNANTGFGTQSAPDTIAAMASIYGSLPMDPLNGSGISIPFANHIPLLPPPSPVRLPTRRGF